MQTEDQSGAILTFHDTTFKPASNVVKAQDRQRWVELEQLRREADVRIEQEIAARAAKAMEEFERRSEELFAERVATLAEAFGNAAREMELAALDLAVAIATRVVETSPPQAFFARAAEHLDALVPIGAALRVKVHPKAQGALAKFCERLQASSVRHLGIVADPTLPGPGSLVVETPDGELDLSCEKQLERIVAELKHWRPEREPIEQVPVQVQS